MTRSFGLDAASALEALKDASERFKNDDLNEDLARDCAIKSWQLCDHVFNALVATSRFTKLKEFQKHIRRICPELAYLQDICIESKHRKIRDIRLELLKPEFTAARSPVRSVAALIFRVLK